MLTTWRSLSLRMRPMAIKREIQMSIYALRKREGSWTVCLDDDTVMKFDSYGEALDVATTAAEVLIPRKS